MNDTEFEVQRQRLLALAEKWVGPLGLGWWLIDFEFARDDYVAPGTTARDDSLAKCVAHWRYGQAYITWNMPLVAQQKDEYLERAFVHELSHIFVNEMRWTAGNDADAVDHEERVCSTLTKAFLWLRDSLIEEKPVRVADPFGDAKYE